MNRRSVIWGVASFAAVARAESPITATTGSKDGVTSTERVLGIGGFFFRSRDPHKLSEWYQLHLGIDPVPKDHAHQPWQQTAGATAFMPFPLNTDYFEAQQGWMLNFRVRNLDAMAAQLQKANIEVKVDPGKYPNGRFARLHDPEGNPIELWEPQSTSSS